MKYVNDFNVMRLSAASVPLLTGLAFSAPLAASEYGFEYGVEAGYEYNDNVRLTPDDEVDISGGVVRLPVTLTQRNERLETSLAGELSFSRYDEDDYDSDDQDLQGKVAYELERGEVEGYAGYTRDSTRTSEFLDTGVVGLNAIRRERATVGGSGSYLFTAKNGIIGGVDYSDVDYDSLAYQDFKFLTGYGGWLHEWTESTQLRLQAYANRFENTGLTEIEADGLGLQAGFDSTLSETLDVSLLLGWANVDTEYSSSLPVVPEDDETDTFLLEGALTYRQERYEIEANVLSEPRPSASGTVVEDRSLRLNYRYKVTERSRLDLGVIVGQRSELDDRLSNDRDLAQFRVRADYRFSRSWYLSGRYIYSYQDRERLDGDAMSNAVFLSVIFQPEKTVWSR